MTGRDDAWAEDDGLADLGPQADSLGPASPRPGAPLGRFRPSITLQRTRFTTGLGDDSEITVDVDHASHRAYLYRDGRHERTAEMAARLPVGDAVIDVAASRYGMQRIHLLRPDGTQRRLDPAPGTPEHWRFQLSERRPRLGRALAVAAVVTLVVNLLVLAPQALELLSNTSLWARFGEPFDSPIDLPAWANTGLSLLVAAAGVERALSLRHHRLLDVETDVVDP